MRLFLQTAILAIQLGLLWFVVLFLRKALLMLRGQPIVSPFVPTSTRYARAIAAALRIKPGDTVYELGSGDGRILVALARIEPRARYVGIERGRMLVFVSRLRALFLGRQGCISFVRGDLYDTTLSDADALYTYLLPHAMRALEPKLERELKTGARLAARAFPLHGRSPVATEELSDARLRHGLNTLYLYEWI